MRYLAGCYLQRRRIKRRSPPPSKVSFYGMQKIQQRRLIVTKAFNFTGAAKEEMLAELRMVARLRWCEGGRAAQQTRGALKPDI